MKRSRFAGVALALAVATALAGCSGLSSGSGSSSGSSGTSSTSTAKGPWKIGYSTFFEGNSWQAQNVALFTKECEALGAKVVSKCTVQNANSSTSTQISQIQGMINQGYNAILLDANSPSGLNGIVGQALSKGIKVVNFDSIIDGSATSKVNTDQSQWGTVTAQWLIKKLNGHGNIIVLNGTAGSPINNARYAGAKKLFAETPGIKVVASAFANWDQATAQNAVSPMLNANPTINGVWSQGGAMTAGAIIDFQKANRPLVPMTGEAYNGLLKQWVANKDKGFSSIAPAQPNYLVTISLQAAIRSLKGQAVPKTVNVPLPIITDATVSKYVEPSKPDSYWVFNDISSADVNKLLAAK